MSSEKELDIKSNRKAALKELAKESEDLKLYDEFDLEKWIDTDLKPYFDKNRRWSVCDLRAIYVRAFCKGQEQACQNILDTFENKDPESWASFATPEVRRIIDQILKESK